MGADCVRHARMFFNRPDFDLATAAAGTFALVPHDGMRANLEQDYRAMSQSSLAPLHLMLADTPWPHGFGATLTNVGPLSEGFERSVASPLQPRRLCAMGRTVRSISSLSDNHSNSFQVAVRFARPGVIQLWRLQSHRITFHKPTYRY
jgi:hypothetical protein